MALRYLLDTDVMIWHLRGHAPTEELLGELETEQPLGCSTLSLFEVWAGVRTKEERATRQFLEGLQQLPVDMAIAFRAAEYWRGFRRQGVTLGHPDALIAATAQVMGLVLVTYNEDHYPMADVVRHGPMPRLSP